MPTELALVCVLTHRADDGAYWFMVDDAESTEKAERWYLRPHFRVMCRWSLTDYIGKRVRVTVRCAPYVFRTADGALREGVRVTGVTNIKLNDQ